jgi:hypothetical protein
MKMNELKLSYWDFFHTYFPHCALTVADFRSSPARIALECIPEETPADKQDIKDLRTLNEAGYGVYFTPCAVLDAKPGIHSLDNFEAVNAVYTDIDIEETKDAAFPEDFELRKRKWEEIAGEIWMAEVPPSLAIRTRNGGQFYWFTNMETSPEAGGLKKFAAIQNGIYEKYKHLGADPSVRKEVQLMRAPHFFHNKEKVKCTIEWWLCAVNDDGSLKYYESDFLADKFKSIIQPKIISPEFKRQSKNTIFRNVPDIFRKVMALPVMEVFERCNGTALTGGEKLEFKQGQNGKIQIKINGKPTPNWLDPAHNMAHSNNIRGFGSIVHYAESYGMSRADIAAELKKIFNP